MDNHQSPVGSKQTVCCPRCTMAMRELARLRGRLVLYWCARCQHAHETLLTRGS